MSTPVPSFEEELGRETTADVCVIGAGMAGLSAAYHLLGVGRSVTVLDDGPIGGGETARTTAHLASALDDRFYHLEKLFGRDGARLAAQSHSVAIEAIERNVRELGIECAFRRVDGYLFVGRDRSQSELDRELAAATRAGLKVESVDRAPVPFDTGRCLRFADQAQFHPLAYLVGLARGVVARGGRIHTGVHVVKIEGGEEPKVTTSDGRIIHARAIVDATNAAISSQIKLPLREAAYLTYAIAIAVPAEAVPMHLYWDTEDPYHYVRVAEGEGGASHLIVGGEDHRTGHDQDPVHRWLALEQWTRERFPMAGATIARWSGQVIEPVDSLALIGRSPTLRNVFIATGDSGHGITHGAIAGLVLPALIAGGDHPWAKLYDPKRHRSVRAYGELVHDAVLSSAPYALWAKRSDVRSPEEIRPGAGAVVRKGLSLLAVYRDSAGVCHQRSAVCPHLRGIVVWNAAEHTWDCPCHGSRFDRYGRVISGPASSDLPEHEEPRAEAAPEPPAE